MSLLSGPGTLVVALVGLAVTVLPALAVADLARSTDRWTWRHTLLTVVLFLGGPFIAAVFLVLNLGERRLRARPAVEEPPSPLLPYVQDLLEPYDAAVRRDYDATELVRWALARLKDEWAERALVWLEQGVPVEPVQQELRAVVAEPRRPQALRDRAAALLDAVGSEPGRP